MHQTTAPGLVEASSKLRTDARDQFSGGSILCFDATYRHYHIHEPQQTPQRMALLQSALQKLRQRRDAGDKLNARLVPGLGGQLS